jgi:hypothetical protein
MNNMQMVLLTCKAYENQLKKLMKKEDYEIFVKAASIEIFRADVESWEDGDFKDFCLEHIDEITADDFISIETFRADVERWGVPDPEEGDELEEV